MIEDRVLNITTLDDSYICSMRDPKVRENVSLSERFLFNMRTNLYIKDTAQYVSLYMLSTVYEPNHKSLT